MNLVTCILCQPTSTWRVVLQEEGGMFAISLPDAIEISTLEALGRIFALPSPSNQQVMKQDQLAR